MLEDGLENKTEMEGKVMERFQRIYLNKRTGKSSVGGLMDALGKCLSVGCMYMRKQIKGSDKENFKKSITQQLAHKSMQVILITSDRSCKDGDGTCALERSTTREHQNLARLLDAGIGRGLISVVSSVDSLGLVSCICCSGGWC